MGARLLSSCYALIHAPGRPVGRDAFRGAVGNSSRRGHHSQPDNLVAPCADNPCMKRFAGMIQMFAYAYRVLLYPL